MLRKYAAAIGMAVVFVLVTTAGVSLACTDFIVKAEDGTVINARSNEFGIPADSSLVYEPAGKEFSHTAPGGMKGLAWKNRYGFLAANGMDLTENFIDGMNDAGLSVSLLLFTESKYEAIDPKDAASALSYLDIASWLLGNFSTVEEVKKALPDVHVWTENIPKLGAPLPLHAAVHDAAGNSIVIEFINGEKKVYDNPIGVMTNMPEFPWHMTNLRNYLNLNPFNAGAKDFSGLTVHPLAQGNGWLGLPADWSSPSRFLRTAQMVQAAYPAKDAQAALNLAVHIINDVDIPLGAIRQKEADGRVVGEYTQWTVFKDLTNKVLYFKDYNNPNLRSIDLKKLGSENAGKLKLIPMSEGPVAPDVTADLKEE